MYKNDKIITTILLSKGKKEKKVSGITTTLSDNDISQARLRHDGIEVLSAASPTEHAGAVVRVAKNAIIGRNSTTTSKPKGKKKGGGINNNYNMIIIIILVMRRKRNSNLGQHRCRQSDEKVLHSDCVFVDRERGVPDVSGNGWRRHEVV